MFSFCHKKAFVILLFLVFKTQVFFSQVYNNQELIPSSHWIYDTLYSLQLDSEQNSLLDNSPISISEIQIFLKSIDYNSLSNFGKDLYLKIQNFLTTKKSLLSFGPIKANLNLIINPTFMFKTNKNIDWSFATDYSGETNGLASGYGNGANYMSNSFLSPVLSIPISISFDKYIMIYAEPFLGKSFWANSDVNNFSNIPFSSSDFDFLTPRNAFCSVGYAFDMWGINLHIAKEGLEIGRTSSGSIIYNSNFETDAYVQLSLFSSSFKFNMDVVEITKNKYMYLHQIEFSLFKRLKLGVVEGTLVNGPFEIRFLNPLMFMHSFGAWMEYSKFEQQLFGESNICQYLGITIDIIPFKNSRLYCLFSMNEIQSSSEQSNIEGAAIPDSFALQLGMEYIIPLKNNFNWMHFSLEGVYTTPYMYLKQSGDWSLYRERYNVHSFGGIPIRSWIGSPFGPDSIGCEFNASYNIFDKFNIDISYLFVAHGINSFSLFDKKITVENENRIPIEISGYYPSVLYKNGELTAAEALSLGREHYLTGAIQYTNEIALESKYKLNDNFEFNSKLSFIYIFNHKNIYNVFEFGFEGFFNIKFNLF